MHNHMGRYTSFNYNSDLSGEVRIKLLSRGDENGHTELHVNGADLFDFIVEYVRRQKINAIQGMPHAELLNIEESDVPKLPNDQLEDE